jgi:2-polyprenyl-3-methyl-5-hydroxy-6-metoxy-1,4-benzoquinol methylase
VLNHPNYATLEKAVTEYFESGRQSTIMLFNLLVELGYDPGGSLSMLEFASGYGCLTRHLPVVMPRIESTACDIHTAAADFIVTHLQQTAVLSNAIPEHLNLSKQYDVVFALSFFSHMPRSTWSRWVSVLYNNIRQGGVLLFTTHGDKSKQFLGNPIIPDDGFWFKAVSEQKDLDTLEYGSTIVTKEFVEKEVKASTGQPVALFKEGYWWGHQDLYGVFKKQEL